MGKVLSGIFGVKPPPPPEPDPTLVRERQAAESRAAEEKAAAERRADIERRGFLSMRRGAASLLGSAETGSRGMGPV